MIVGVVVIVFNRFVCVIQSITSLEIVQECMVIWNYGQV